MHNVRLSHASSSGAPVAEHPEALTAQIVSDPATSRVVFRGELGLETAGLARAAIVAAQNASLAVIVDLTDVTIIDSHGTRTLLDAQRSSSELGQSFAIARSTSAVERPLSVGRLDGRS